MDEQTSNMNHTDLGQRQLTENCLEYFLFIIEGSIDKGKPFEKLESVRKAAVNLCQSLTNNYIWQREEFHLELETQEGKHRIPIL